MRLAGVKLALQLNKGVIGAVEPVRQHRSDIKDRDRIMREKTGRLGDVKLRCFQRQHVRRVRLIQQNGQFTKYSAGL